MSVFGGPDIVTDGLVLHLDAANRKSYPLSGSTIYDLSGNGNNGTFGASTAAPTFSGDNGGCLSFDGSDDYIDISNFDSDTILGQDFSVSFWMKGLSQGPSGRKAIITNQGNYNTNGWGVAINQSNYGIYSMFFHLNDTALSDSSNPLPNPNDWHMITFVYNNSNNSQYFFYDDSLRLSFSSSTTITNSNTSLKIGGHITDSTRQYKGCLANVSLYNTILSPSKISQNYNALKGRYGL